jgi:hypothetical protein
MKTKIKRQLELLAAIKRDDSGLDDLFDYSAVDVETIEKIKTIDGNISSALIEFTDFMKIDKQDSDSYVVKTILSPSEINEFIPLLKNYKFDFEGASIPAHFINKLIQSSYNSGNNDFFLNIPDGQHLRPLAFNLEGKEKDPIILSASGELSYAFLFLSKNVIATIDGNLGDHFCHLTENVTTIIVGNVKDGAGWDSKNLKLAIKGNVGNYFGKDSINLSAYVNGEIKSISSSINKSARTIYGQSAIEHDEYKRMMQMWEEKFK